MPTIITFGAGSSRGFGLTAPQITQAAYWLREYSVTGAYYTETYSIAGDNIGNIYSAGIVQPLTNNNYYSLLLKYDTTGTLKYFILYKDDNSNTLTMFDWNSLEIDNNNYVYCLVQSGYSTYAIMQINNSDSANANDKTIDWVTSIGYYNQLSGASISKFGNNIIASGTGTDGTAKLIVINPSGNRILSKTVTASFDGINLLRKDLSFEGIVNLNSNLLCTGFVSNYYQDNTYLYNGIFFRINSTGTSILNEIYFSKQGQIAGDKTYIEFGNIIVDPVDSNIVYLSFKRYNFSTFPFSDSYAGIIKFNYITNTIIWQKGFDLTTGGYTASNSRVTILKDNLNNIVLGSAVKINNKENVLVAKFNSSGNLLYQNILYTSASLSVNEFYYGGISFDKNNNIIITGVLYDVVGGYTSEAVNVKLPNNGSIPDTIVSPWVYESSNFTVNNMDFLSTSDPTSTINDFDPGVLPTVSITQYTYMPGTEPAANFSGTPFTGADPLTVNFTDLTTNNPTSWAWDFTNNGSVDSTLQNPSYTYTTAGTYSVKLTATNQAGSNTIIKTNYITAGYCAPYQVDYFPWATYLPNYNTPNFLSNSVYNDPQYDGVNLNLNLGGYAPSWTGGASFVQLIYLFTYDNSYGVSGPEIGNDGYFSLWNEVNNFSITNSTVKSRYAALPQGTSPGAGHHVYPGVSSYDGSYAYITARNFGQPIVCELWYSLNQSRNNPLLGYSNYTFFGDQFADVCPDLFFNNPSSYVKKYQVGILKATADMYNLTDNDFIAGISYVGGASGGTIKTIHNGSIITQRTYTGKALVYIGGTGNMDFIASGYTTNMGTAKSNVNRIAFDIGFSDNSTDSDYWGQWFVNSNPPDTTGLIDTYQVKWAWIIDCETNGLEERRIDWGPGMCYTLPNVNLPCAPAGPVPNYTPPAPLV